jgi:alpha-tubulin suppressor-like RCC1 family protein
MEISMDGDGTATGRNMDNRNLEDCLDPTLLQSDIEKVATGGSHVLVLKKNGELWGWGYNAHGQLGIGYARESVPRPQQININFLEGKKISFIGDGAIRLLL